MIQYTHTAPPVWGVLILLTFITLLDYCHYHRYTTHLNILDFPQICYPSSDYMPLPLYPRPLLLPVRRVTSIIYK